MLNHEDLLNGAFGGTMLTGIRTYGESPRESAAAARSAGGSSKVIPLSASGTSASPVASNGRAILIAWLVLGGLLVFANVVTLKVQS